MDKKYKKSLFIFHRDLRLEDNTGLIQALIQSNEVIPTFIFTKTQIEKNEYKGDFSLYFMIESLRELNDELKKHGSRLSFFYGDTNEVIELLIKNEGIEAIFSNRDYTPFAIKRDQKIETICKSHKVSFKIYDDALLHPPEAIHKPDGTPYVVFSPFFKKSVQIAIKNSQSNLHKNYYKKPIKTSDEKWITQLKPRLKLKPYIEPGRKAGLKLIKGIKNLKNYKEDRNIPSLKNSTSHLSAHHKFGTISIRETLEAVLHFHGPDHHLMNELFWRDFLTHIAFHFPHVFKGAFKPKYDHILWKNNPDQFKKWCNGETGFPIVDAGMRQLNQTGYMHNRVRMIVASFLTKDLHIDWQWGEKYFAQQLIDYDPCVNNGNWQWAASTGCDAQPYFRIFNPWRQQERFDKEAIYIKRWVPELKEVPAKIIHKLYKLDHQPTGYPEPIIDHSKRAAEAKLMFKHL